MCQLAERGYRVYEEAEKVGVSSNRICIWIRNQDPLIELKEDERQERDYPAKASGVWALKRSVTRPRVYARCLGEVYAHTVAGKV